MNKYKFLIFPILFLSLFVGMNIWASNTTYLNGVTVTSTTGNATTYKGEGDPSATDFDAIKNGAVAAKANLAGGNTFTGAQVFQGITADSISLAVDSYGLAKPINYYIQPAFVFPPRGYITSTANYINYYGDTYRMAGTGYQDIYTTTGTAYTWRIDDDAYWSGQQVQSSADYKGGTYSTHYADHFTEWTGVLVVACQAAIVADGSDNVLEFGIDTTANKQFRMSIQADAQETHTKHVEVHAIVKPVSTGGKGSFIGIGLSGEGTTVATVNGLWIDVTYDANGNILPNWFTILFWEGDSYYYHDTGIAITPGYHSLQLDVTSIDGVNADTWNAYVDGQLAGTEADAPDGFPAYTMAIKSIDTWSGDVHGCLWGGTGATPVNNTTMKVKFLNQFRTP